MKEWQKFTLLGWKKEAEERKLISSVKVMNPAGVFGMIWITAAVIALTATVMVT